MERVLFTGFMVLIRSVSVPGVDVNSMRPESVETKSQLPLALATRLFIGLSTEYIHELFPPSRID